MLTITSIYIIVSGRGRQEEGAGVRLMEAGRGSKGPLYGRTMGPAGTWAEVYDGKGGNQSG